MASCWMKIKKYFNKTKQKNKSKKRKEEEKEKKGKMTTKKRI